jgi:hypothetical protein
MQTLQGSFQRSILNPKPRPDEILLTSPNVTADVIYLTRNFASRGIVEQVPIGSIPPHPRLVPKVPSLNDQPLSCVSAGETSQVSDIECLCGCGETEMLPIAQLTDGSAAGGGRKAGSVDISSPVEGGVRASSPVRPTRKQVSRACDWCRARRIKCDNGRPCKACRARDVDCTHRGGDEPRTLPQALR